MVTSVPGDQAHFEEAPHGVPRARYACDNARTPNRKDGQHTGSGAGVFH